MSLRRRPYDVVARRRALCARYRYRVVWLIAVAALGASAPSAAGQTAPTDQIGQWSPVVSWPTMGKHLVMLPNDKALVFSTGNDVQVWDTVLNTFTPMPAPFGDIHCAGHATLADGRVIVIGGVNVTPQIGIRLTAIYDPWTNQWTVKTPMKYARWYPTATTLPDGRLLATSGTNESQVKVPIPEIYDPATDTWTELPGANRVQPFYPFMYVLPDGRLYDAAPKRQTYFLNTSGSGSWTPGPLSGWETTGCCTESGAMYGNGKIIRTGGNDPAIGRTAIVDMTAANPQWEEVEPMAFPRRRHNLVILLDGTVMAIGGARQGDDPAQAVLQSEIWNPDTKTWDTVASLAQPRMYHSAAMLLPDGRVVAAGGDNPQTSKRTAQFYSPPYLFKGARPQITSSPAAAEYGTTFDVTTDAAAVSSVALIRSGAVTHSIDMNQRYVPLRFTQSGTTVTASAPADANVAPPGYYLLVAENSAGIPSPARWIRIGGAGGNPTPPPPPPPPSAGPTAAFTANPTSGTAPLGVQFTDTSTGSPSTWAWDFQNDGSIDSTARHASFTYASAGSYTVKLTVSNADGTDSETKAGYITVNQPPSGGGATVRFAPEADARVQEANPTTNYATSYLRADGAGDPDVESYLRFSVTGISGVGSAKLRVYATSGTGNGPAVYAAGNAWSETAITWSNRPGRGTTLLEDKGAVAGNSWMEFDVSSVVGGAGTYTFVLATNTTDGVNANSREATTATLRPELVVTEGAATAPVAAFTASPTTGYAPLAVAFTNLSTGSKPMTYEWDFTGDGVVDSTAENPTFTYTEYEKYTVTLRATNSAGGDEEVKVAYIDVLTPPDGTGGPPVTFVPVADAHVKSDAATQNAGTSTQLRTDTVPAVNTYVKVAVSGLSGPARSAKLRLFVVDPNPAAGSIYLVDNGWTETGITWSTAPPISGAPLSSAGAAALNTWVEFDVTSAITGSGTFSFAIKGGASDSLYVSSRQATSNRPELVVTP